MFLSNSNIQLVVDRVFRCYIYIHEGTGDKHRKFRNPTRAPGCSRGIPTDSEGASSVLTCVWMAAGGHAHSIIALDGELHSHVRRWDSHRIWVWLSLLVVVVTSGLFR